jgi:uncharacterized protein (DUF3084 family)
MTSITNSNAPKELIFTDEDIDREYEMFAKSDKLTEDLYLTDQDQEEIKKARENPKLQAMVRHVDLLVERAQKARHELNSMIQASIDLRDQCRVQKQECTLIDAEQKRVQEELVELRLKVTQVSHEKQVMEKKLDDLKLENDELEAFLTVSVF